MRFKILIRSTPESEQELVAECKDEIIAKLTAGALLSSTASYAIGRPIFSVQIIDTKDEENKK